MHVRYCRHGRKDQYDATHNKNLQRSAESQTGFITVIQKEKLKCETKIIEIKMMKDGIIEDTINIPITTTQQENGSPNP
jgi:hypothetical protein